ncbi:MAG: glycosyltransferase family 39 protein [Proteobacteria bacterium]|nr:glycosyltransferase family 39 protein [Pseudomonadota bacterium]
MKDDSRSIVLLVILIMGLCLLTWQLDEKSFWCDELFTIRMADSSPGQILATVAADLHPPLYFLAIKGWAEIAGTSEGALRLPSVFFALVGLWCTWRLGVRTVGRNAAQIGVMALACSPLFVEFSRMARYYSMTLAFGVLATLTFVNALERKRWLGWIVYGSVCALLIYTFYLGAALILAHGLFFIMDRQATRSQGIKWLLSMLIVIVACAVWLPVILGDQMIRAGGHRADFAGSLSGLALSLVYPWYAFSIGETIFPWFPTAVPSAGVVLGLIIWWFSCHTIVWSRLMLLLILLPVLFASLVTNFISTGTPFLNIPVRALFIMPYFSLALGAGWVALPRLSWRIGLALLIGITWAFSLFNYYTNQQFINPIYTASARQVARQIAYQAGPHDVVIGEEDSGFSYYYLQTGRKTPYFEALHADTITAYITTHQVRNVWLVTIGRDGSRRLVPQKIKNWLKGNYCLISENGYAEQDPIYRKVKEFFLHRPTYRYRMLVQRYERLP